MEKDYLVKVVSQLYHVVTGQKPDEAMDERLKSGVEAALKIKEADANLFYGLVAIGLVEAKHKLGLSMEGSDYADQLIKHYVKISDYMKKP